jgi:L,D-peptidoglycan transpeptidase YkuD (ErfK/YbiS/YcfS/YnhG family)
VIVAVAVSAALASCAPPAPVGMSTQLVSVSAESTRTTYASVTLWGETNGCWRRVAGPWRARVGRNGLSAQHREGDGTTPLGTYRFETTMYGLAANPGVRFRYHRLLCGDWWNEDPASPTYNTFQHIVCNARPRFAGDSEALWRQTRAYRYFAVIAYNTDPVTPGRGSAMFVHDDVGSATNGCVSLQRGDLVTLLRWLTPAATPRITIAVRH